MDIGIGRGLAEARALAVARWQPLLLYVGLGVVLPFALLSSEPIFSLRTMMAIVSAPWTYRVGGSVAGPLYLLGIVSVIVAGSMLAAWSAILSEIREGAISELMYGMVAGVAYLIANLVLALVVGVVAALPLIVLGPGVLESTNPATGVALQIYRFLTSLAGAWIGTRFYLAGAIMGGRGKLEPVSAFIESWRLTRPVQWRLFGFYLLYGLIFAIPFVGLVILHGAVILSSAPGGALETLASVGWVLLFALYFLGQILIPAGLYRGSNGTTTPAHIFS